MGSPHVLAAIAQRLNRDAGATRLPSLYFFTDPERTPDPIEIAKRLPRGVAVVYRHFGASDRARIARQLAAVCRSRGLLLLIAADPELARRVGAHGVHWPEARLRPRAEAYGMVTTAAHSANAVVNAAASGVDAVVLGPIFPTRSSAGRRPLGLFRASQLARAATLPVIALGGINAQTARLLAGRGFAGLASIDGLARA